MTDEKLSESTNQGGFSGAFRISAKTGDGVDRALDFLIRKIMSAEKNGLYVMPIFQRDHHLRRISLNDDGSKRQSSTFKNLCC